MPDRPRFRLVLEVQPGREPAAVRLRALLKFAGRRLGLKCRSVEEVLPTEEPRGEEVKPC